MKIDGWVAVNPEGKVRKYTFSHSKVKCQKIMCDIFCNEKIFKARLRAKIRRGWQVRPIMFVFLDREE